MITRNPGGVVAATIAFVMVACLSVAAQEKEGKMMIAMKGIQGSFVKQSSMVEKQFLSLAEAIPQEKYAWRPADGVRSIAEAFLHCARGNYVLMPFIGGKVPEGMDPVKLETSTTDKKAIAEAMKGSFKTINDYVGSIPDSDLDNPVKFFGMDMTVRDMIMLCANHQHELLGQAVAYARMNNVVPPWTAEREARMKEEQKKN